jgi:hypothetical protein
MQRTPQRWPERSARFRSNDGPEPGYFPDFAQAAADLVSIIMRDQCPLPVRLRLDQTGSATAGRADIAFLAPVTGRFRAADWFPRRSTIFAAGLAVRADHGGPVLIRRRG